MVKTYKNQAKGALAIFVKTPGLSPIKTRLAALIEKEKAEEFFCLCVKIIEEIVLKTEKILKHTLVPYWAVAEKEGLSNPLWQNFSVIHTGPGDLGLRLHHVYSTLLENYAYVILIGIDSPTLTVKIITDTAKMMRQTKQFVIGPAYDGGFYLFAGNEVIPKNIWLDTTYSTDTTLNQLIEKIVLLNKIKLLQTLRDIDVFKDLLLLKKEITKIQPLLPAQKNLMHWLEQFDSKNL